MSLSQLRSRIHEKAAQSAGLEPTRPQRAGWRSTADALIDDFIDGLGTAPAHRRPAPGWIERFDEGVGQCTSVESLLALLQRALPESGIRTAGPGHLGFVPGGGLYVGAIADYFAAAINVFCADAFSSPVAAHIHGEVLRWLAGVVGYDDGAWGDVTSGGSLATLTAVSVARHAGRIHPRQYESLCVYATHHTHHCCEKSLDVLFAGAVHLRHVPVRDFALDAVALEAMIRCDQQRGLVPWMVIANAGTTNLGAVDPIRRIGELARSHGLWMHVDAAYGGFFALCPSIAPLFDGLSEADSIVLDPHKGMFLPYGCGAVLFKRGELLHRAFSHSGAYLQDRGALGSLPRSPMDGSLELSRPFRSLRLWLALKSTGPHAFRSALEEKLALAQYCYESLRAIAGVQVLLRPQLSILAFRFGGHELDLQQSNQATKQLWTNLRQREDFFLSTTTLDDMFVIRIAILSFRTHLDTLDKLIEAIRQEASALAQSLPHDVEST
jgi:glutamate/tyrosine decarboxylase-like PLP-dependent enzyme